MSTSPDFGQQRDFYTFAPESLAHELPQFAIGREVGKGSMGIVYEATIRATGRRIALKVLPPSLTRSDRALARFQREGQIMARIAHPDIVGFVDQGMQGALCWFAMEFVDGVTLEERLRIGPLPVQKACRIAARVARALQYAHEHGVVHRDVKPGNVMLRNGQDGKPRNPEDPRPAITDFGLARETGTGSMTDSGAIVGTPMYMAPEVVLGGSQVAGTLADVYSLGATLYTLVTGAPPFDGPTAQSVLKAVLESSPRPPRRLRRDLPEAVAAILGKAMARDPARRYGSADEFAADLERFVRGERVQARLPGLLARGWRACAERPLVSSLLLCVSIATVGVLLLLRQNHDRLVERDLAAAERLLALAATERDELDRPRSPLERREQLLAAVAAATATLRREPGLPAAWLVRARAHQRLHQPPDALDDLDRAEALLTAPTVELLQLRIDVLRTLGNADTQRRLLQDLTSLLRLDPTPHTRALVAEQLLDFAAQATGSERAVALERCRDVLGADAAGDARAAVAMARVLELSGDVDGALSAMRRARTRHEGNLYVHLQAAAMFDRHDLLDEGAREHEEVQRLAGDRRKVAPPTKPTPVDIDGLGTFLGDVDRVLQALDPPPAAANGTVPPTTTTTPNPPPNPPPPAAGEQPR